MGLKDYVREKQKHNCVKKSVVSRLIVVDRLFRIGETRGYNFILVSSFFAMKPHGLPAVESHVADLTMKNLAEVDSFEMLATRVLSSKRFLA